MSDLLLVSCLAALVWGLRILKILTKKKGEEGFVFLGLRVLNRFSQLHKKLVVFWTGPRLCIYKIIHILYIYIYI